MVAAITAGKFLDWNFRRLAKQQGMELSKTKQQDLTHFPIELARLQVVVPLVVLSAALLIIYGWIMQEVPNVGAVCVLIFFIAWSLSGAFQGMSTLVVDLNRSSPGAATAAMNLSRCWIGAGGVALVGPLTDAIGYGWVAVIVAGAFMLLIPIVGLVIKKGPKWREEKRLKHQTAKEERAARDVESGEKTAEDGK